MTAPAEGDTPLGPGPARPWRNVALLAVVIAGAAALTWTALGRWQLLPIGPKQYDYYNLLVGGFRKGSLALDIEVPAALKTAPNPMEVFRASPGMAPHDLSLYKGHYYSYYGVVPAVVLFWPFRVLAQHDLPLVLGTLVFSLAAFVLTVWLWMRVVRDQFPKAGVVTEVGGAAVVALAAGQWALVRRISIWEPSIVAGHFFLVCMLAASYQALRGRREALWLALAGVSLGLAAGSRPTLVVAALGLFPLVWAVSAKGGPLQRKHRLLRACLAAGLPLGIVGALLLYYNWARFGNPLELGLNHQLSTWNEVKKSHFRLAYIPFNFFLYFLANPQWGRYFPFVHPIAMPRLPYGYYGYEYVYGALILCPALWWGAFTWRVGRGARGAVFWFAMVLAAVAAATTPIILCFDTSAARYGADFLPWWTWLALLGWCNAEAMAASARPALRRLVGFVFAATAAFSCATAFFCSADLHGILERENPGALAELGRVFNLPTAIWERATGFRGGAVSMDLVFAPRPIESVEPLIVTGVEYQRDYVYVYYQSDHVVRLAYLHPGEPAAESGDITVVPGKVYPVQIACGALYPPEGHPRFNGWQPAEVASVKRWARIVFDGRVVVSDARRANEASPGTVQVGKDDGIGFCGRRFAGTISNVHRLGWNRPIGDLGGNGDIAAEIELPHSPSALPVPLVEFGHEGSADIVGVKELDGKSAALVYESFGTGIWQSGPVLPTGRVQMLRIRLGSMLGLSAQSPISLLSRSVVVWRDGKPIWWRRATTPVAPGGAIQLLSNGVHSTAMAQAFEGRIVSVHRLKEPAAWRPGAFSALRLRLGGRGEGTEPLVATGAAGRADVLGIEWLSGDRARLVYDHWGTALRTSAPFEWGAEATGTFRIAMPSLTHLGGAPSVGPDSLDVDLDGTRVWRTPVLSYPAGVNEVAVGRNTVGSSVMVAELRSAILDVAQDP